MSETPELADQVADPDPAQALHHLVDRLLPLLRSTTTPPAGTVTSPETSSPVSTSVPAAATVAGVPAWLTRNRCTPSRSRNAPG